MFQRRHMEAIAETLRNTAWAHRADWIRATEAFADMLANSNPKFNNERFYEASRPFIYKEF